MERISSDAAAYALRSRLSEPGASPGIMPQPDEHSTSMEGWLRKRQRTRNRWQERYFRLSENDHGARLLYFSRAGEDEKAARAAFVVGPACRVSPVQEVNDPKRAGRKLFVFRLSFSLTHATSGTDGETEASDGAVLSDHALLSDGDADGDADGDTENHAAPYADAAEAGAELDMSAGIDTGVDTDAGDDEISMDAAVPLFQPASPQRGHERGLDSDAALATDEDAVIAANTVASSKTEIAALDVEANADAEVDTAAASGGKKEWSKGKKVAAGTAGVGFVVLTGGIAGLVAGVVAGVAVGGSAASAAYRKRSKTARSNKKGMGLEARSTPPPPLLLASPSYSVASWWRSGLARAVRRARSRFAAGARAHRRARAKLRMPAQRQLRGGRPLLRQGSWGVCPPSLANNLHHAARWGGGLRDGVRADEGWSAVCCVHGLRVLEAPATVTTAHGNGNGGDDTAATSADPAPATQPPAGLFLRAALGAVRLIVSGLEHAGLGRNAMGIRTGGTQIDSAARSDVAIGSKSTKIVADAPPLNVPCLKASVVAEASPGEALAMLLGSGRGAVFPDSTVLQRRNSHLDVIHARLQPVYLTTLRRWSRPRDLCLLRYWQQEEDGTCVICFQSIEDNTAAPVDQSGRVVRARLWAGGCTIAPPRRRRVVGAGVGVAQTRALPRRVLITLMVQVDPGGWLSHWQQPWWSLTGQSLAHEFGASLLPAILDTMQLLNRSRFVRPTHDNTETAADGDAKGADEGKEIEGAVSRLARRFWAKIQAPVDGAWIFAGASQEPDDESARATKEQAQEQEHVRETTCHTRERAFSAEGGVIFLGPTVGPTLNGASSDEG